MEVIRALDKATCGHVATGSLNVFINGRGVTRCFIDKVDRGIITPGPLNKQTIFVNGFPIAVVGDLVSDHGNGVHTNAKLLVGSLDVLAY